MLLGLHTGAAKAFLKRDSSIFPPTWQCMRDAYMCILTPDPSLQHHTHTPTPLHPDSSHQTKRLQPPFNSYRSARKQRNFAYPNRDDLLISEMKWRGPGRNMRDTVCVFEKGKYGHVQYVLYMSVWRVRYTRENLIFPTHLFSHLVRFLTYRR